MKASFLLLAVLLNCQSHSQNAVKSHDMNPAEKAYWYAGDAEITSYSLEQARYGEMHEGKAVLIFVTEPFSKKSWTKADNPKSKDLPALKLNFTKEFSTGIYPYSLMTSTFYPVDGSSGSLKISSSSQEWCGHMFRELKNKAKFEIRFDSYFEGESNNISLSKDLLEDDIWSIIRLHPEKLPIGETKIIPSFQFLGLTHTESKAYTAKASSKEDEEKNTVYTLDYPALKRTLQITYASEFPRKILSWTEVYESGYGTNRKTLSTTAKKIATLKTTYWEQNGNKDSYLRSELGLDK
ncbi:MAG: hypothetical protein ACI97P_001762 [Arcticibacterium sp.]|jgi:hypothetical protein